MTHLRKNHCRLLEMVDEGTLDPLVVLEAALAWMADRDIKEMMEAYAFEVAEEEEHV